MPTKLLSFCYSFAFLPVPSLGPCCRVESGWWWWYLSVRIFSLALSSPIFSNFLFFVVWRFALQSHSCRSVPSWGPPSDTRARASPALPGPGLACLVFVFVWFWFFVVGSASGSSLGGSLDALALGSLLSSGRVFRFLLSPLLCSMVWCLSASEDRGLVQKHKHSGQTGGRGCCTMYIVNPPSM